jgi:EAL domain-containing protein (putative c-di-GMP-specific phosphodiesterase class I)
VFIPVAEELGLIGVIGRWVLREACRAAATWPEHLTVAVNMSPAQFGGGQVCGIVTEILRESGLKPQRLEIEITEGLLLGDTDLVISQLTKLKELGVSIVMDDFGTGYSSLGYLRSFPFDKIKIDRSFVSEIAQDEDCAAIIRAISGLGRSLRIRTTAEGVETAAQLGRLRDEGCTEVQGYYFSPPRPASEVAGLLAKFGAVDSAAQAA